jgi:hypothetical protein
MGERQAAPFVVDESTGRSMSLAFSNTAPARTRATRCGAFTARQRASAASISLNAIASPAAREPGPLVTLLLKRTVAKVDSIVILSRSSIRLSELVVRVVDGVVDVLADVVGGGSAGADCYVIVTCSGWGVAELAEGVSELAAYPLVLVGEFAVAV